MPLSCCALAQRGGLSRGSSDQGVLASCFSHQSPDPMESFATPYPLIFFDGEQEQDKGLIGIHSMLTYRRFQSLLSQKTGIPPSQLSAFFVCRRTLKDTQRRQRLPINGNTNFSILINQHNPNKERDCYFLVCLKKSKKERKGMRKRGAETDNPDDWESNSSKGDLEETGRLVSSTVDDILLQEQGSPFIETNVLSNNLVPGIAAQRSSVDISLHGKIESGGNKIGRILLKRQIVGPNVASVPRRSWNSGGQGVDAGSVQACKADDAVPQAQSLRNLQQREDPRRHWIAQDPHLRGKDRERLSPHAPFFLPPTPMDFAYHPYDPYDAFSPERLISNAFSDLRASSLSLQRSGGLPSRMFNLSNFSRTSTSSPMLAAAGSFVSKFVPGSSAPMPSIPPRETDLRRAHSHLLQMQQQMSGSPGGRPNFSVFAGYEGGMFADQGRHNLCCEVCFDCKKRNVSPIPFHWCVQDEVTRGFGGPSPAGPIGRPPKTHHVEAAA